MRINVYAEELTDEVTFETKVVEDDEFGRRMFYGIRLYLHSTDKLHHSKEDDDRSAITFWVKATKAGEPNPEILLSVANKMRDMLLEIGR